VCDPGVAGWMLSKREGWQSHPQHLQYRAKYGARECLTRLCVRQAVPQPPTSEPLASTQPPTGEPDFDDGQADDVFDEGAQTCCCVALDLRDDIVINRMLAARCIVHVLSQAVCHAES